MSARRYDRSHHYPEVFNDSRCVPIPLKSVENDYMAVPELHASNEPLSPCCRASPCPSRATDRERVRLKVEHGPRPRRRSRARALSRRLALPSGVGYVGSGQGWTLESLDHCQRACAYSICRTLPTRSKFRLQVDWFSFLARINCEMRAGAIGSWCNLRFEGLLRSLLDRRKSYVHGIIKALLVAAARSR